MSAIAISPALRANTVRDVDTGKYTRTAQTLLGTSKIANGDESTRLSAATASSQATSHTGASLNDIYDLLLNERRSRSLDYAEVKSRLNNIE